MATLTEFIQRGMAFFEKADTSGELSAKISTLEKDLETAQAAVTERDAAIKDLQAALEKAAGEANAFSVEVKTLKAAVEKEAAKANETIAAQGIPADKLPEAKTAPGANSILARLDAITDPVERAIFWQKNKAEIMTEVRRK